MTLDSKDISQQIVGAFSAVFGIYILRGGNPLWIDPTIGLIMGVVWLSLLYSPLHRHSKEAKYHFISSIIVSLAVTTLLTVSFNLGTIEQLKSFDFFGSTAWLTFLLAIPISVLFDLKNITNPLSREYIKK